jgi:hypothetical protein
MSDKDEIVFENLRGVDDTQGVTVTLETADDAIRPVTVSPDTELAADAVEPSGISPRAPAADDDEGGDASKNSFDKRLGRERRAKLKERDGRVAAEKENDQLRQQLHDRKKSESTSHLKALDDSISSAQTALKAAMEKGDTDETVEATDRLSTLRAEKIVADNEALTIEREPETPPKAAPRSNDLATDWMDHNNAWYGVAGFEKQTRIANEVDQSVERDGEFAMTSPEYFAEVDKRLRERLPGFFDDEAVKPAVDDDLPPPKRGKPVLPVAGVDGDDKGAVKALQTGKVELGPEDFAIMRRFNLDPKNPEHLKEFAANRRERLTQEAADRGAQL